MHFYLSAALGFPYMKNTDTGARGVGHGLPLNAARPGPAMTAIAFEHSCIQQSTRSYETQISFISAPSSYGAAVFL